MAEEELLDSGSDSGRIRVCGTEEEGVVVGWRVCAIGGEIKDENFGEFQKEWNRRKKKKIG